jgi:hypothetical protein
MINYTLTAFAPTGTGISTGTVSFVITSHEKTSVNKIKTANKNHVSFADLRGIKGEDELASLALDWKLILCIQQYYTTEED